MFAYMVAQMNTQIEPDLDDYHDMTVGQILRRTREYYGQSMTEVEQNLRIRSTQLRALEEENMDALPGRVYAIGFVRAYSEYLGLDGDKMVHLFKSQTVGKRPKPQLQYPVTYTETNMPNAFVIIGCMVVLIGLISYWSMTYKPSHYIEVIPEVPEELKQSTLTPPRIIEEKPAILKENIPNKMELHVTADSWVEIKDATGKTLIREVLKPGDKYIVPEKDGKLATGMTLSTGNAGGITVYIDGKKKESLGDMTEVRRAIKLNPADFL